MFYHDHAWGITRLNVYAGEAAGYLITDDTEKTADRLRRRCIAGARPRHPARSSRTDLRAAARRSSPQQDPTWDAASWGGEGNLWYHHVYMPAQNPGDPSGMSAFGRWMYGPWFWPPATRTPSTGRSPNPYYDPACDPTTCADWFCEPRADPRHAEHLGRAWRQFNDTPIVNGTAYPTTTVDPKAYRFRILNAANDRFWNLQWYVADSTGTEVALKAVRGRGGADRPERRSRRRTRP